MDTPDPLLSSPLGLVLAGVFGAVWGSFFNVCIARIPLGQSVVRPASRCLLCSAPVRARDNIPILSYFLLRGRCRACGGAFSARYPLVEALAAALAVGIWWKFVAADPDGAVGVRLARFALYFAFGGALLVLSFIDLDTQLLPDVITLPSIPILFLAGFGAHDVSWQGRLIGAVAGYLFVRIIADFYYYVLKREGLGLGDGKLLAMIGAVFGWKALPFVVFAGAFAGAAVSIPILLVARRRARARAGAGVGADADAADGDQPLRHAQIPFGPFLALGALLYLFAGREILMAAGGAWL